jgi:hypothetical protein
MIKYLFIVINSLSLFIFGLFSGDNSVTVTSTIPASMAVGQEMTIELKVSKGSMNGFAKLQLDLPEGIIVKDAESKDADYSFSAGVAKWVWAMLPADNEIVIKVVLEASGEAIGTRTINAKYSYVDNNVKQVIEMTPAEVNVLIAGSSVAAKLPDSEAPAAANTMAAASSNSEPPGKISVERIVSKVNESEYLVTLKIKKGLTKGFAKYSDDVIEQVTAKAGKTDGSSFSTADGKIKFVWVNVPEKDELEVSYTMTGNFNTAVVLNGEYSYLEENQSKKYKLAPETISPSVAQTSAPVQDKPDTNLPVVSKEEAAATEAKQPEDKKEEPAEQLSTDVAPKIQPAVTEKKEGNTNFVIQIGAFTSGKTDAASLKKNFKITEAIKSEMQDGYSKFMIGSHAEYKDARYHKEVVRDVYGIKSAFVVAYSGNKRITVQEALMITNQKWFK